MSDTDIEEMFIKCGGLWNGDNWIMEDADLHVFVRTLLKWRLLETSDTMEID